MYIRLTGLVSIKPGLKMEELRMNPVTKKILELSLHVEFATIRSRIPARRGC
ncbi:hypothetical protein Enr10x_42200 [Gimesia panareensis]|uniref:Uncharacterized protein n=1 Tax=Gimesia panareensis TaxID=2527978 RepID=A0A518AAG5_9PLAN|nr:hypothetical protein Enr10x_42200 [Gimesia panareensis]QDU51721.1 hypothetical protein Pan110_40880 [Gimesia panareensis]